jgi:hypothetical protein
LEPPRSEWVFAHDRARFVGDGYASLDMALSDLGPDGSDHGLLVGDPTRLCFFTLVDAAAR